MLQYVIPTNTPPVLAAITDRTIGVGVTLNITNLATDSDVPAQTLTFSLPAAPTNAVIDATSGVLTWRPLTTQANSTNRIHGDSDGQRHAQPERDAEFCRDRSSSGAAAISTALLNAVNWCRKSPARAGRIIKSSLRRI